MNQDILDFYSSKNLHMHKIIRRKPYNVTQEDVEAAAVEVYEEVQEGLEIRNLYIVWEVWRRAKAIDSQKYTEQKEHYFQLKAETPKLKAYFYGFIVIWGAVWLIHVV